MQNGNKINSFEDLIVWQKAIDLSVAVYKLSRKFPKDELYSLTSQIRRASNSVSLNISEGSVRSTKTFIYHLRIARGSASEVLSAAILAKNLGFITDEDVNILRPSIAEVTKILNKLISTLKEKDQIAKEINHSPLTTNH
jgi:four helix bundle protein